MPVKLISALSRRERLIFGAFVAGFCILAALIMIRAGVDARFLFFDGYDLGVYYRSSRWIIEGGTLYLDVASEYPLLANVIFAFWRAVGHAIRPDLKGFSYAWVAGSALVYIWVVHRVAKVTTPLAAWAWLAPAPLYFALFRFDIYPAAATLLFLLAVRRGALLHGALWLGIAVALKGYALFMLPAFCIFMLYQRGFATAFYAGTLALLPMAASLLVTWTFAGWEGIAAPFLFHSGREFNGESTYDSINFVMGTEFTAARLPWLAPSLQIAAALAAAAMLPRDFDRLVQASLIAVIGFMSFSVFYSPQFVLWILPLVSFSASRIQLQAAILLSWMTYLYFPVAFRARSSVPNLFRAAVLVVALIRLFIMAVAARQSVSGWHISWKGTAARGEPA